jgi:Fe-S cluster assembly protein SufD
VELSFDPQIAARLPGDGSVRSWRERNARSAAAMPAPDVDAEEWRYSRVGTLDPSQYDVPEKPAAVDLPDTAARALAGLGDHCGHLVTVDGHLVSAMGCADADAAGVRFAAAESAELLGSVAPEPVDAFAAWNGALAATPLVLDVPRGANLDAPFVVLNHVSSDSVATFPRLVVRCGENSSASLIEVFTSDDVDALVVPVTELAVGPAARLSHTVVQDHATGVWQVGNLAAAVGQQATLTAGVAQLGGSYSRLRIDCMLEGRGAAGDVAAAYLGTGNQMIDLRTFQEHRAPDTTSNLFFKGALGDSAHSVYTGLIRIDETGQGTDAVQSNRVVKLSEDTWAESVPNLEIHNNDVRCAHASTVGPVDPEQKYYLETRGVPPRAAERLIVGGFFDEALEHFPVGSARGVVADRIDAELDEQLTGLAAEQADGALS